MRAKPPHRRVFHAQRRGAVQRVLDAVDDEPRDPPGSEEWPEWSPTSEFRAVRERQRP